MRSLTFDRTAACLLFIAIGFAACFTPAQNDTWWHLRAGQETWLAGGVQLRDTFSYTAAGAYWPNQEWLGEVVLYALYHAGGLPLMTAFAAALVLAAWALVWRITEGPVRYRVAVCALAVMASSREWALRPKVFTLFFVALTLFLIARRRILWLPPAFVLWANLHAGVMLGVVIVWASGIALVIQHRRLRTPIVPVAAACVLATALTPLGLSLWTEIGASMLRIRQYPIDEWRPPQLTELVFLPFWILAAALLALVVRATVRRERWWGSPVVWSALALIPLAMNASRNIAPAMFAVAPAVMALAASSRPMTTRVARERPALNALIVAGAAKAALVAVAFAWIERTPHLAWDPVPARAAAAVSSCSGPLYNRYDDGGFVIWFAPGQKVFMDGRQDPFPPALVHEHIDVERSGRYAPLFARYGIRCAFLPAASLVARNLATDGWTKTYADPRWEVLVRP